MRNGTTFSGIKEKRESGKSTLLAAFFSQFDVHLSCSLNKELPDKVAEILGPMFMQMGVPVDMLKNAAKVFNHIDIAF